MLYDVESRSSGDQKFAMTWVQCIMLKEDICSFSNCMRLLEFGRRTFIYYTFDKRSNRAEKQSLKFCLLFHEFYSLTVCRELNLKCDFIIVLIPILKNSFMISICKKL